jgi:hypothetical protein
VQLCAECNHVQHTDPPTPRFELPTTTPLATARPSASDLSPYHLLHAGNTCRTRWEHLPHPRIPTFFSNCIVWQSRADSTGDAPVAGPAGTIIGGPPKNANGAAAAVPSFASLVVIALAAIGL